MTRIRNMTSYDKSDYREIFDVNENESLLKVYVKSKAVIYDVPLIDEAVIEKEEFCAGKFTFYVLKDKVMSFNQGDAVSVKFNGDGIFYGYVFSKRREKDGVIQVICYDQMRYLKNKRTYTRGSMSLGEIVRAIGQDNALHMGSVDSAPGMLGAVAAESVSLLDVIRSACSQTRRLYKDRYILYDDFGRLTLKNEDELFVDVLIDASAAEDFSYRDTIDKNVYNMVELYYDTKRDVLRDVTVVSDKDAMEEWGSLILSVKATKGENSQREARTLLEEYCRINREIVLKKVKGDVRFIPGSHVQVKLTMGDLRIEGYVRVKKTVHKFKNNFYSTDIYVDGSDVR